MSLLDELLQSDKLVSLVQKENFVGWVYSIDYNNALVVTNDDWKHLRNVWRRVCYRLDKIAQKDKSLD